MIKHIEESIEVKQQLLENEGIVIIDNQIQNLATVFWDPSEELSIS